MRARGPGIVLRVYQSDVYEKQPGPQHFDKFRFYADEATDAVSDSGRSEE